MFKVYSKKALSVIVASSLVLSMGTGVMAKGPAKAPAANSNPVVQEDGRNTNGLGTALITFAPISGYYGTTQVVSGEVVIDGARDDLANLYITVGGQGVDQVWAVPGQSKTYGFTATVHLDTHDLTNIEVIAETKFHNGQKAGKIHSNNSSTVDVDVLPVITDYAVNYGTEDKSPNFVWDEETGKYSLTFTVIKTLSNGEIEEEEVTLPGLIPGDTVTYGSKDLDDENYFGEPVELLNLVVPAAPVVEPEVVTVTGISELELSLNKQGPNQFKVVATYTIHYSNGTTEEVIAKVLEGGNISNPTTQNQNSSTRNYEILGFTYEVTVTYDKSTKEFSASAVLK